MKERSDKEEDERRNMRREDMRGIEWREGKEERMRRRVHKRSSHRRRGDSEGERT